MQKIINGKESYKQIGNVLKEKGIKKFMLVCRPSFFKLGLKDYFDNIGIPCVYFTDFTVNPKYEEICLGVDIFNSEACDAIVAVGGGSAIDVAKCIKVFSTMPKGEIYYKQPLKDNNIPLLAVPTTAGTGSESTRFSVFYHYGEKQSIDPEFLVPEYAFLDATLLYSLPEYQKKCTLLDALCQAIESWWSVHYTKESIEYAKIAVEKIIANYKGYIFGNDPEATEEIMLGSNYAGRAINITSTTSAHAMSYKMTTLYGIPHGHAVGVGLPHIWEFMNNNTDKCIDKRGKEHIIKIFGDIAVSLGGKTAEDGVAIFKELLSEIEIEGPKASKEELKVLALSVNTGRLKNNPVELTYETLYNLYSLITKNDA